jgi:hypothetical protein
VNNELERTLKDVAVAYLDAFSWTVLTRLNAMAEMKI